MNKTEYENYKKRVERGLSGLQFVSTGPCPGCADCGLDHNPITDEEYAIASEPGFSWSSCDACGSSLGGNRHPAHGFPAGPELNPEQIIHLNICEDCLYYIEYGKLDDETMMEIEKE